MGSVDLSPAVKVMEMATTCSPHQLGIMDHAPGATTALPCQRPAISASGHCGAARQTLSAPRGRAVSMGDA